jgi:hypothetical protein
VSTWATKILEYMDKLDYSTLILPTHIGLMNPYADSDNIKRINELFYKKYYEDTAKRWAIIGINPGRLGAGATGIPFTDTKRLTQYCNIDVGEIKSHEPSSVYMYDMINAFSNPLDFYQHFYITSAFPLGFTTISKSGKEINYNYYDDKNLQDLVTPYILQHLKAQIEFGVHTDKAFCLGSGKNFKFLSALNQREKLFNTIVPLEHPRYIMQYKLKQKDIYIQDYIEKLSGSLINFKH